MVRPLNKTVIILSSFCFCGHVVHQSLLLLVHDQSYDVVQILNSEQGEIIKRSHLPDLRRVLVKRELPARLIDRKSPNLLRDLLGFGLIELAKQRVACRQLRPFPRLFRLHLVRTISGNSIFQR